MPMLQRLLTSLLFLLSSSLFLAADGPTIESMQERLEAEIATLDAERDERIKALRTNYVGALERRINELGSGNAEAVAALRKEKERVADTLSLQPAPLSDQAEVRRFQEILVGQIEIAEKPRTERLETLIGNLQNFANTTARNMSRQGQAAEGEKWEEWAKALPARYFTGFASSGGKSRFMTLLEAGQEPYLLFVGTSTAEHTGARVNAPWQQCAPGNRSDWPPVLSTALQEIGKVRIGGSTCAGVPSPDFIKQGKMNWVIGQKPDAVLIEFGPGTDAVNRFNITVAESRAAHEEMIKLLRNANPEMEIFFWNGLRSFNQGRRNYWNDRNGSDREASDEEQPEYAQMYRDLVRAAGPGVYLIDTYKVSEELYKKGESSYRTYFRDGNHANTRGGQEIIVPEVLKVFKNGQ